jgi:hypothetical protein
MMSRQNALDTSSLAPRLLLTAIHQIAVQAPLTAFLSKSNFTVFMIILGACLAWILKYAERTLIGPSTCLSALNLAE